MKKYILTIDQGTTGTTAFLIEKDGTIKGAYNEPFKQHFPKLGWVEHDPQDILNSVKKSIKKVMQKTKVEPRQLVTLGVTNQRETVVFWNRKTGKPYGRALVWQCRRTTDRVEELQKQKLDNYIRKKTGLSLDPYFSSTKIEWFLNKNKNKKNLCVGTVDTFLMWHLTGGKTFATEPSNASRTQLFNIKTLQWDKDLLKLFGVDQSVLPNVLPSNSHFGEVKNFAPLPDGLSVTGVLGDQQSSLFGHGALKAGEVKCTFGTGSFILLNTGEKLKFSKSGLLSTVGWQLQGQKPAYALEGGAFNCASCLNWARDEMGLFKATPEVGPLSEQVKDAGGVLFAPTFSGVGAPYWNPNAMGAFLGLTRGARRAHLAKAMLEGLSFQNALIFKALEKDHNSKLSKVHVDGGVSHSDAFMKIQSQFAGLKLVRPQSVETTALGAAYMAGLGAGVFKSTRDLKKLNPQEKTFQHRSSVYTREQSKKYDKVFTSSLL